MTFSIAGYCSDTGQFGTAISSSSICVASRCPFVAPGKGAVLSQNVTNPALGQLGVALLEERLDAQAVLQRLLEQEAFPEWRQLLVLDANGHSAVHSGAETLGIHATRQGHHCVAGGNMLATTEVVSAMVEAFEAHRGELAERLLAAMEAGQASGGEMGPVHSAGLTVTDKASWPSVELRVDWHIAPLTELRMIWENYRPQRDAYLQRAAAPQESPSYGVPGDQR
ncbi:DUF1028 domain-containing protein [Halomonas denitrificans]|uniref:DUF1028 domain-containing protein n=1 Tax=Halomonas denitrificans TaxID=370769 RepID=UPI001C9A08EC|nr:DUF1028 domain-containing protein [Halomonas denitrificans]MBY5968697.1 DUF1028 domain-containing protein [Halomonas denitrificans]